MALKFTKDNFEEEVLQSDKPVIVDFYADWCGPCKMMAPVIDELSEDYEDKAKVGKLNIDENREIASKYNVMSIPTIIFVKDGEIADQIVGAVPKTLLEQKLENLL